MSFAVKIASARAASGYSSLTLKSVSSVGFKTVASHQGPECKTLENKVDVKEHETSAGTTELLVNLDSQTGESTHHRNEREKNYAEAFQSQRAEVKDLKLHADGTGEGLLDIKSSQVSGVGSKTDDIKVKVSAPMMKHMMQAFGPFSQERNGMGSSSRK